MDVPSVSWQPEPNFRGTFSILATCFTTLFVCVWSAVHLDIMTGRSKMRVFVIKLYWVIGGLWGPASLFYLAYVQFREAQCLQKLANDRKGRELPAGTPFWATLQRFFGATEKDDKGCHIPCEGSRCPPAWTLTHGFYAAMGGFVLKDPDLCKHASQNASYLPEWQRHGVLTPAGVEFLLMHRPDLIPDISYDEIMDRSKADWLAKALLVWQVAWFLINCLNRLIQGLPLCLLEVSTIAHGLCALLTYVMWWDKPLNIRQPTVIAGEGIDKLGAWMSVASGARSYLFLLLFYSPSERYYLALDRDHPIQSHQKSIPRDEWIPPGPYLLQKCAARLLKPKFSARFLHFVFYRSSSIGAVPWHVKGPPSEPVDKEAGPECRWVLSAQAEHDSSQDSEEGLPERPLVKNDADRGKYLTWPLIAPTADVRHSIGWGISTSTAWWIAEPWLLGLIVAYGAVHFLGWNAVYPTAVDRMLWRIATIARTGAAAIALVALLCHIEIRKRLFRNRPSTAQRVYEAVIRVLTSIAQWLLPTIFAIAGGIFVVEEFRQIARLPPEAFRVPTWSYYWPHAA